MIGGGVASNDALEMACNNNCSRMLDNILVDECGVSLLNIGKSPQI